MRALAYGIVAFSFCLATGCGGDTHATILEAQLELMEEAAGVLESVKTAKDASVARGKMDALVARANAISKRHDAIGPPTKQVQEQLKTKYRDRMTEIEEKFARERQRLGGEPWAKDLISSLNRLTPPRN